MRDQRNSALDGLRGLAALTVVVFHVWVFARPVPGSTLETGFDKVMNEARLGLILFFVLSGYLLYGPWVRAAAERMPAPELRRYLIRRAARILPAYYLALVGSVVLLWGAADSPGVELPPASALPLFLVFGQNLSSETAMTLNPPTWTLAIEASFYLALPLLGWLALKLPPTRRAQVALPLALVAIGLGWNALTGVTAPFTKVLPTALPYFGAGMLVAVLARDRVLQARGSILLALGGAALIAVDGVMHVGLFPGPFQDLVSITLRNTIAAAGFAAILGAVVASPARVPVITARPMVALGTISYGLYLWHAPLILWLRSVDALPLTMLAALPVVLAAGVLVATASWFALERPALAWAHARTRRDTFRPVPKPRPNRVRTRRRAATVLAALSLAVLSVGCGEKEEPDLSTVEVTETATTPTTPTTTTPAPTPTVPPGTPTQPNP